MKQSDKLLIGVLTTILIALVSVNMGLKAEYQKIDLNDRFFGYSTTRVQPFKVLKVLGDAASPVEIQSGTGYEIRTFKEKAGQLSHRFSGDTLEVSCRSESTTQGRRPDFRPGTKPVVYILTPSLETIVLTGATCRLSNWNGRELVIVQEKAGLSVTGTQLQKLTLTARQGSIVQTDRNNRFGTAFLTVRDSAGLYVDKDIFGALALRADSGTTLRLPGGLFQKAKWQ